jgi:hypothetical protein
LLSCNERSKPLRNIRDDLENALHVRNDTASGS